MRGGLSPADAEFGGLLPADLDDALLFHLEMIVVVP